MAKKAHQQKVEEETADAQKAMQRNSETMAAFVQQLAQPKAQAMAQPGIARKGGFFPHPYALEGRHKCQP